MGNNMLGKTNNVSESTQTSHSLSMDISQLGLTAQKIKILRREGIFTIGDFEKITRAKLGGFESFGKGLVAEIEEKVRSYGGSFQEDDLERIPNIRIEDSIMTPSVKRKVASAGVETLGELLSMPGETIIEMGGPKKQILRSIALVMEEYGYDLTTGKPIGDTDVPSWKIDALEGLQRKGRTKLRDAGIIRINQLIALTQSELEAINGIGTNLSEQLIHELRKHGLELKRDEKEPSSTESRLRRLAQERVAAMNKNGEYARRVEMAHELYGRIGKETHR